MLGGLRKSKPRSFEIDFVPTDGTRLLIVEAATSVGCRFSEQLSGKQCA